jgi:hypothetical protein
MTFLEAAKAILRETGRPMTAREVTDLALKRGLIKSSGKTPDATLLAQLYGQVRDNPDGPIVRVWEQGPNRARRGTVRWAWREPESRT